MLSKLIRIDQNKIIGGRTIAEIVKRFQKKLKDPRDGYKGKLNVRIIKDYLKINLPLQKAEKTVITFFIKNKLPTKNIKNYFKKIILINKKIGKKYVISFKTDFGRNADYSVGQGSR